MRNCRSTLFVLVFAGIFALLMGPGLVSAEVGVTETTIKIGNIQDTTGMIAGYGLSRVEATKALFQYINDEGGIHGRKLVLAHESDDYRPANTIIAFKKLVEVDKVFAFIECLGVSNAMAIAPDVQRRKIPFTMMGGMSSKLYEPPRRYIFGLWPSYVDFHQTLVNYLARDLKMPKAKVAFLYQDSESGMDSKKGFLKGVDKYPEMKVVAMEKFDRRLVDYSAPVYKMRQAKPDAILVACVFTQGAAISKEIKKVGWKPLILLDAANGDPLLIRLGGPAVEGVHAQKTLPPLSEDLPGINFYKTAIKKYYPKSKINPSLFGGTGFIEMWVGIEGLKRAGRNLTREGYIDALESFRNVEFGGMIPPVSYGPDKHWGQNKVLHAQVQGGKWVMKTGWRGPE
ncbi:ABC transporter substrate-binding protein [Thermodesulfobacteriota bacterium]